MVLYSFRIRLGKLSRPVALDISKLHRCVATSSEMVMSDSWKEEVIEEMDAPGFIVV